MLPPASFVHGCAITTTNAGVPECRSAAQYTVQGQFEFEHNDIAKKKQGFNSAVLLCQLETAKRKLLTSVYNCSNVDRACRGGGHHAGGAEETP